MLVEIGLVLYRCFWRVLMSLLCVVTGWACFMCICLKPAIWLFLDFLGQGLAFFGEDRLATLLCSLARFDLANRVCASRCSHTPMLDGSYSTSNSAASFCSCKLLWRSNECVLLPFFNTQPKCGSYDLLCRSIEFIFIRYPNLERW